MALTWDYQKAIEATGDREAIMGEAPDAWPVSDCIIWLCMITGIPVITDRSAEDFWHRVHAWETITGPINTSGRRIEPRDIALRVGLHTNASPLTEAQWRKKLVDTMRRDSDATWHRTAGGILSRAQADEQAS